MENKESNNHEEELNTCKDSESIEVMYNEIVRLYELEMDSFTSLKDKTYGIIIFNGTIITLITLALVELIGVQVTYKISFNLDILLFPYIFLILSLLLAIHSYRIADLAAIGPQAFHNEFYCEPKYKLLDQLASNIADDTEKNKDISKKRSCSIKYALYLLAAGVIAFSVIIWIYIHIPM